MTVSNPVPAPLDGVRVVDFGQYIAAPGATQILADLGAEVVKAEPPRGDQARGIGPYGEGIVRVFNRGKRAIAVDLKHPEGRALGLRLAASADVVVQNLRPGAMARLGLGPEDVHAVNPRAVYVAVTGFGPDGPSAQRVGLDIAAQAESGMMAVTGETHGDPQRVGFAVVDAAASYAIVQAVLAALLRRERTGSGGYIEVSLLDVAVHLQSASWGEWGTTGQAPARKGNGQSSVAPAADVVRTKDGHVVISAYADPHWHALCRVLGKSELALDPRFTDNRVRVANRPALLAELDAAFGTLGTEECVEMLARNGIVAGAVRSYPQVREAADVVSSGIITRGRTTAGEAFEVPALPFRMDGWRGAAAGPVPEIGAHTVELMAELGYTESERERLLADGVVADGAECTAEPSAA
jgi:crotonobetainyl-CoA:carnitine CoA-transferase CaiB-like acyl-CoA transferase